MEIMKYKKTGEKKLLSSGLEQIEIPEKGSSRKFNQRRMIRQVQFLILKEIRLEWKQKYAFQDSYCMSFLQSSYAIFHSNKSLICRPECTVLDHSIIRRCECGCKKFYAGEPGKNVVLLYTGKFTVIDFS